MPGLTAPQVCVCYQLGGGKRRLGWETMTPFSLGQPRSPRWRVFQ